MICKETDFSKCGGCAYAGHSVCARPEKNFDAGEASILIKVTESQCQHCGESCEVGVQCLVCGGWN